MSSLFDLFNFNDNRYCNGLNTNAFGENYGKVVCPKCGKKHFRVKVSYVQAVPAIAKIPIEPEYNDGAWVNKPEEKPFKYIQGFHCLECDRDFTGKYTVFQGIYSEPTFTDDEDERERRRQEWKAECEAMRQREEEARKKDMEEHPEKYESLTGDDSVKINANTILVSNGTSGVVSVDTKPIASATIDCVEQKISSAIDKITCLGKGDKTCIDLGDFALHTNKRLNKLQKWCVKVFFGWKVSDIIKGE